MKKWTVALAFVVFSQIVFPVLASAITLDEYLAQVKRKNRLFTSYDLAIEASNDKRTAGDLVLAPVFSGAYSEVVDKSLPSTLGEKRKISEYSLGVTKRFSTGTQFTLLGKTDQFANTAPATTPPAAQPVNDYSTGSIGISVQQSLWKDSFGAATRLRNQREEAVNKAETLELDLRRRGFLIDAEANYWDYSVAMENLNLKKENLERARKLDKWTTNRVSNGISDRSDLMTIKALSTLRELEMQSAQDELKIQEVRFRQNLELADSEATPVISGDPIEARPYMRELLQQKNVISIDAYLATLQAKSRKLQAEELVDSLKPDLALTGSYGTTGYDVEYNETLKQMSKTDKPRTSVGVSLTWIFDNQAKKAQISAAEKDALVSQYTADKKRADGLIAWTEHVRRYTVAQESVKTLEKIAYYQRERAKAEQDKFSKGRTITANVVNAETDSAEAEVNYLTAKSGLRKLEAATLLFTSIQE